MKKIKLLLTFLIVMAFGSLTSLAKDAEYPEKGTITPYWHEHYWQIKNDMDDTYKIDTVDRSKDESNEFGTKDSSKYNWRKIANTDGGEKTIHIIISSDYPVNLLIYNEESKDSYNTNGAPKVKCFNQTAGEHMISYKISAMSGKYIAVCNAYNSPSQKVTLEIIGNDKFNNDYKSKYVPENISINKTMTSIDKNFFYESTVNCKKYTDTSYHFAEFNKNAITDKDVFEPYKSADNFGGLQKLKLSNTNELNGDDSKKVKAYPCLENGEIQEEFRNQDKEFTYIQPSEFFKNTKNVTFEDIMQADNNGSAYRFYSNELRNAYLELEGTRNDNFLTYISVWKIEDGKYVKTCDRLLNEKKTVTPITLNVGYYYIFVGELNGTTKVRIEKTEAEKKLENANKKVTQITMPSSKKLGIGKKLNLKKITALLPADAANKTITWKSSKSRVASVSDKGVVNAKKIGTAVITATCGNVSATCTIKVVKNKPTLKIGVKKKVIKYSVLSNRNVTFSLKIKSQSKKKQVYKNAGLIYIKVSKRGKITVPQGLPKGKYKVKVAVVSPETKKFKKREISKYITIVVK